MDTTKRPGPYPVRFPPDLRARITAAAERSGISVNKWVVHACTRALAVPLDPIEERVLSEPAFVETIKAGLASDERVTVDRQPSAPVQVVEIESRPVAGMHQWRVKGEDEPMGTVPYRREIEADARRKLAERFGHPVEVRHK